MVSGNEIGLRIAAFTHQKEIVVLRLAPQVLEDSLFPKPLHQIPVLNLTLANRVSQPICLLVGHSLISNVEIEVLHALLLGHLGSILGGNHRGDDELGLGVSSETHLRITFQKKKKNEKKMKMKNENEK